MEKLNQCPICSSTEQTEFADITDHFLTKEVFTIVKCKKCSFLFTNPRPSQSEISSYYHSENYISHKTSKLTLFSKAYAIARSFSLCKKHSLISKFKQPGKILDIGCGTGEFLKFMKHKSWEVTGIEPADSPRAFARNNYALEVYDEQKLDDLPPNHFDVITLWHVLEHVTRLDVRMRQIKRLLARDGLIIIALPNHESWDAKKYDTFWAAWDTPRHLYHFSQKTVEILLSKNDFTHIDTLPLKMDAFYISFLSEKYQNGKSSVLKAIINGCRSNYSAKRNLNNYSSLIYLFKNKNSQ